MSGNELNQGNEFRCRPHLHKACFRLLPRLLLSALLLSNAQAALLFYEGFDYPQGAQLGEFGTSQVWENDKDQFIVAAESLDYARIRIPAGNHLKVAPTGPSLDSVRTTKGVWSAQSDGALYLSFLLKVESPAGLGNTGHGTSLLTVGRTANNAHLFGVSLLNRDGIKLGVVKYSSGSRPASSDFCTNGIGANLPANGSATCLVVARYEWVDGPDNDIVTVWVNPENPGGREVPAGQAATRTGVDSADAAGRLTLSRGPHVNLDEIRIGQTWADVMPSGDLRGPANNDLSP